MNVEAILGVKGSNVATTRPDATISVAVGLLITAILVANNLRDIETDAAASKRTLAVRIGRNGTRWLYLGTVGGAVATVIGGVVSGTVDGGALLGLAVMPAAIPLVRTVFATDSPQALIRVLAGTSQVQAAWGLATAAGVIWLG